MKKSLLTACCALVLGTLQVKAQLVAHYSFDNLSGTDISGNGLNAYVTPSPPLLDTTDHFGASHKAAWFANTYVFSPGSGSGFGVAHNALLNFTDKLSISIWINPHQVSSSHKIVDKLNGDNTGNFLLDIYDGTLRFWVASGHVEAPLGSVDTWFHVVATYDGTSAKLYINNALAATANVTGNLVTNTSYMYIGFGQTITAQGAPFWGAMDDLRIFGNALSAAEINTIYNETATPIIGCLVSKWTFDNGNANDETGIDNGNVNGATLTADRFGNTNQAYSFDGVDDVITFDGSHFEMADFTLSFWYKSPNHNYKTILQKWSSGNGGFAVDDYPQGAYSNVFTASTVTRGVNISAYNGNSVGVWHHVVISNRFNDSASFYFDGVLISTNSTSFAGQTITGNPQFVLGTNNAHTNSFAGEIDDVLIYNCALTDTEITALYTKGGWGTPVTAGIDELSSGNVVNVYPNPANRVLDIEVKEATTINVVNLFGATVWTQQLISGNNSLDVSNLRNGVYFIQSDQGGTVKFVKE